MNEMTTKEILSIIKDNNIKYFSYTCDCHYETVYFLQLYKTKHIKYDFNNKQFQIRTSEKQIKEIMKSLFGRCKTMMSCVWYQID